MKSIRSRRHWCSLVVALLVLGGTMTGGAPVFAAGGTATSSATPSNATPSIGDSIVVTIAIDISGVAAPDNALGSFTGTLDWDPAVLTYSSNSGIQAGFTGVVNTGSAGTGHIVFNGAKPSGATGNNTVLTITFDVVGAGTSALDLGYSAMSAASTFANLLPLLTVTDGQVVVTPAAHYSLTLAVDPVGGGTTEPGVGAHTYPQGTVVAISATPNSGYVFDSWTGDADCADGSVTMNAAKTCTATFVAAPPAVTVDGAFSSKTGNTVSSLTIDHTTGTGTDRLLVVGVSWNCGTTDRSISSVTFTPSGGSAIALAEVITQLGVNSSSDPRYSAIYSLLNPPSGVAGTVTVTFSGSVSNGIVAGVANFAGVDQTTPLGTPGGGLPLTSDTAPTVSLTGLNGDELVFDNVFQGASAESQTLTAGTRSDTALECLCWQYTCRGQHPASHRQLGHHELDSGAVQVFGPSPRCRSSQPRPGPPRRWSPSAPLN